MGDLKKRWEFFSGKLGVSADIAEVYFNKLVAKYNAPERYHHTLGGHIAMCIDELDAMPDAGLNKTTRLIIEAALWFHDAYSDPKFEFNELHSASFMSDTLYRMVETCGGGLSEAWIKRTERCILATNHKDPENLGEAEKITADIDLAIFGKPAEIFQEYEKNVRREYEFASYEEYRIRRIKILLGFLKRNHIYRTEFCRLKYEARARNNLANSIIRLAA